MFGSLINRLKKGVIMSKSDIVTYLQQKHIFTTAVQESGV